ncbi:MAG: hypothetical protein AAFP82_18700, partial [Bacteroidota bacterium]
MQLSEQEIIRRENLQKIEDLGFTPFPAAKFDVDFNSQQITTAIFHEKLAKKLEKIKGIDAAGAVKLRDAFFKNRSKAAQVLADEALVEELGLSETVSFEEGTEMELQAFFDQAKAEAIGIEGNVRIAGRFMGQRGPFAKLQDSVGRIQLYIGKKDLGNTEEEQERYKKLVKLFDIGDF